MKRGLFLIACLTALLNLGCARTTHHSDILVNWPTAREHAIAKNNENFQRVVQIVDEWAKKEGFFRVAPQDAPAMRQHWTTSAANGNEQALHFREQHPQDKNWPLELMVAFDPDMDPPLVHLAMAEGYRGKPSPRLRHLHASLVEELTQHFGQGVRASIW